VADFLVHSLTKIGHFSHRLRACFGTGVRLVSASLPNSTAFHVLQGSIANIPLERQPRRIHFLFLSPSLLLSLLTPTTSLLTASITFIPSLPNSNITSFPPHLTRFFTPSPSQHQLQLQHLQHGRPPKETLRPLRHAQSYSPSPSNNLALQQPRLCRAANRR
jgi:hypothetical protein